MKNIPDLNPGIAKLVAMLLRHNFKTTDSGDGETHVYECDRDEAYVAIVVDPHELVFESKALKILLEKAGVSIGPVSPEPGAKYIQATYDPANQTAILDLVGVKDSDITNWGAFS